MVSTSAEIERPTRGIRSKLSHGSPVTSAMISAAKSVIRRGSAPYE